MGFWANISNFQTWNRIYSENFPLFHFLRKFRNFIYLSLQVCKVSAKKKNLFHHHHSSWLTLQVYSVVPTCTINSASVQVSLPRRLTLQVSTLPNYDDHGCRRGCQGRGVAVRSTARRPFFKSEFFFILHRITMHFFFYMEILCKNFPKSQTWNRILCP